MIRKIIWSIGAGIFVYLIAASAVSPAYAASLKFDPSSVTTSSGSTFEVKVDIDPGQDQVVTSDAYILYNKDQLEFQSVANGTYFDTVTSDGTTAGKVYIGAYMDDIGDFKTGTGTLATVTFKAKAASGSSDITFDCTAGSTTDSNIIKYSDTVDIIVCAENGKSTVTIGSGGLTGTTPTPTSSVPTPTSGVGGAPEELPKTGFLDNILRFSIPGLALVIMGVALKFLL